MNWTVRGELKGRGVMNKYNALHSHIEVTFGINGLHIIIQNLFGIDGTRNVYINMSYVYESSRYYA
jgi:hypothetical protein